MRTRVAVDQVGGTTAGAVLFDAPDECCFDFRVIGQTEVVVTAKADDSFAINDHIRLLRSVADAA